MRFRDGSLLSTLDLTFCRERGERREERERGEKGEEREIYQIAKCVTTEREIGRAHV